MGLTYRNFAKSWLDAKVNLDELKSRWVEILNNLEGFDRSAWLAFFDGRLASLEGNVLTLDFRDPSKFEGGHDLSFVRDKKRDQLVIAISNVTGEKFEVREM